MTPHLTKQKKILLKNQSDNDNSETNSSRLLLNTEPILYTVNCIRNSKLYLYFF